MNPDVLSFAVVSVIIVGLTGSLATIGVIAWKILTRKGPTPTQLHDDDRLERLQQSVDAIAIEVERIAEAQRFTAKLLMEKGEAEALRR